MIIGARGLQLMEPFTNTVKPVDSQGLKRTWKEKRTPKGNILRKSFKKNSSSMKNAPVVTANGTTYQAQKALQDTR